MPVRYRFDLKNFDQVPAALEGLVSDLKDFRPFFKKHFVPEYLADMQVQFETEGGFVGGWEPLTREYARWKASHSRGKKMLQRTSRLKNSFSPGGRSKYLEVVYGPRSARIRSTVAYAGWVNQLRPVMIPPRALARNKYRNLLIKYLEAIVAKNVGKPNKPMSLIDRLVSF